MMHEQGGGKKVRLHRGTVERRMKQLQTELKSGPKSRSHDPYSTDNIPVTSIENQILLGYTRRRFIHLEIPSPGVGWSMSRSGLATDRLAAACDASNEQNFAWMLDDKIVRGKGRCGEREIFETRRQVLQILVSHVRIHSLGT